MTEIEHLFRHQLEHRTIRAFKDTPISQTLLNQLLEVTRQTATSNGMQQYSIIHVTDQGLKDSIAKIAKQAYISTIPTLLIFIVDQYRNAQLALESCGKAEHASDADKFFQGFTDAALGAQNTVNAAESVGLGTLFLGSILNDSEKMCELLALPELTFPVVGLGLGYPDQAPQLKPRMSNELKVFENTYKRFDHYLEEFKGYDEAMQTYYDLRNINQRMDSFSQQAATKMNQCSPKRQAILDKVRKQGFQV